MKWFLLWDLKAIVTLSSVTLHPISTVNYSPLRETMLRPPCGPLQRRRVRLEQGRVRGRQDPLWHGGHVQGWGWAERWSIGCVNSWPAAQEAGFTKPRKHLLADPCTAAASGGSWRSTGTTGPECCTTPRPSAASGIGSGLRPKR